MATLTDTYGPWLYKHWPAGLVLSPRLRGVSVANHFVDTNSMASSFALADLEATTDEATTVKGPNTLVFEFSGSFYKIPISLAYFIGPGYNSEVVWRYSATGDSGIFKYCRDAPSI